MKISYHLTVNDYLQYSLYTNERIPAIRQSLWGWRWLPGIVLMAVFPALTRGYADAPSLLAGLLLGGVWILIYPPAWRRRYRKLILGFFKERDDFTGDYGLELADDCLAGFGPGVTFKAEWRLVNKVVVNRTWIYIYFDALQAVIVPLEAFRDIMEYNEFLAKLGTGTGLPLDILKVNTPDVAQEA